MMFDMKEKDEWEKSIVNGKGINSLEGIHMIIMEENGKLVMEHKRRINIKIKDALKHKVLK